MCLKIPHFANYYFTSDTLYSLSYYDSIIQGTLGSFHYSHLPNIFPEAIIILPLLAAHTPWQIVYESYSFLIFTTFILSARNIYYEIIQDGRDEAFYLFMLSVVALFFFHPGRLLQVLLAGLHGGSFVASIVAATLAWRFLSGISWKPWAYLFGLVLITCVATFSDVLFFGEFVAPLVAASLAVAFFGRVAPSKILILNLSVIGAAGVGAALLHLLPISPFPPSTLNDLWQNSFRFFSFANLSVIALFGFPFLAIPFWFGSRLCPGSAWYQPVVRLLGLHSTDNATAVAWSFFWIFGVSASLVGLVVTVIGYQDFGAFRYAIAFFWWSVILGATLFAGPALRIQPVLPGIAVLGAVSLLLGAALWPTSEFWASDLARCLEEKSHTLSMHAGLAGYWTALPVTKFSKRRSIISPVTESGDPMIWLNNSLDYFSDKKENTLRNYDFIVLNQLDKEAIFQKFGTPSHKFECGVFDVAQYDDPSIIHGTLARWLIEHR